LGYFASYALYCTQNWLSCGEVHCAVTAPGFLLAAGLQAARIGGMFGPAVRPLWIAVVLNPWVVVIASFVLGKALEMRYASRHGTIFMLPKH